MYLVGTSNDLPSSLSEDVFNLFFCYAVNLKLFLRESRKKQSFAGLPPFTLAKFLQVSITWGFSLIVEQKQM